METIIKLKGVTKQFRKDVILDSVDLEINRGEIFGIIGMSGSGKSTLLNTMIGFYEPDSGEISYKSKKYQKYVSLFSHVNEIRKNFGFATQAASFYPRLTVEENLDHFASLYGIKKKLKKEKIEHLLKITKLDLARTRLAQNLSGGMEKRLSISCSLIHGPDVLLLDEPTADLDPLTRRDTWEMIKEINSQGTTIIVASHFLAELEEVSNRLGIIHKGKVVSYGSPQELKKSYFDFDEIIMETSKKNYTQIGKLLQRYSRLPIETISIKDDKLYVRTKQTEKVLHQLLHIVERVDGDIISADIQKPSLTEVFESLDSVKKKKKKK
jgi:ABC-2 type transport system ATP-binding protein